MKIWMATRNILFLLVAAAAAQGLVWLALNTGLSEMIVPQPKTVAEEFSGALAAHRWNGALELLSQRLRQQVREEDLRELMQEIEQSHPYIENTSGESEQKQGDWASAVVSYTFTGQRQTQVVYELVRENRQWKISSFDGLRVLAGGS